MLYTSNEEFDFERRVHLTNEIPPYDMYEGLNPVLQTTTDEHGEIVPTIWKWVLGSSKVGYNLPYSIRREDEDGKYEDNSASNSLVGRYDIVRDEPDDYGDSPIDNNDVFYKSVNGVVSPVYGPRIEGDTEEERRINGLHKMYHSMAIDGVWLPEFDLLLHENYRYLENLYPDHPDYRYLLTKNEVDDSFNAAGAVVDYKPANKFFDKVAASLNTYSLTNKAFMSDDDIEQESLKIKIRNLRNNAFRRKFYGSKTGYKMLGADIFNNVTVYPVATYLPIKDVAASELLLEKQIRENLSDESAKQAELDALENAKNAVISAAEKDKNSKIQAEYDRQYNLYKKEIDAVQSYYISENERLSLLSSPSNTSLKPRIDKNFGNYVGITLNVSNDVKKRWHEDVNALVEDETGDFEAQFKLRAYYDEKTEDFNKNIESIYTSESYIAIKEAAEAEYNRILEEELKKYNEALKEINEKYAAVDTLKEWNKKNGKNFSAKQFLEYCRKNNRIIDTYSELYYRKFRLIDWTGEKNAMPEQPSSKVETSGQCLPFYNKYIFINDTSDYEVNDIIERNEQNSGLVYITEIEKDRVKVTQDNAVEYKTLYLYKKPSQFELSDKDLNNISENYAFKNRDMSGNRVSQEKIFASTKGNNWLELFYGNISRETLSTVVSEIKVVEHNGKIIPEPHFALTQYSSDSELTGERNLSEDLVYPVSNEVTLTQNYISKYNALEDERLAEVSIISSFNKGTVEVEFDVDAAIANANYKKLNIKSDQRYALVIKNEENNDILLYGSPKVVYGDAGIGMNYIKKVVFCITGIPAQKPESLCNLIGSDTANREYFFGSEFEYEDAEGNEKKQEKLLVGPGCKVVGMWEASVLTTTETNGTAESYHKTKWAKIDRIISGKIKNFSLGHINVIPLIEKNALNKELQQEVEIPLDKVTGTSFNICEDLVPVDYEPIFNIQKSIINDTQFLYENVEEAELRKSTISENLANFFKVENNVSITLTNHERIEIECVLDATNKDLVNTLKFENETAKKVMKTLSVGDKVFGTGIDSDDNDVFITSIGDNFIQVSSPVQTTGTFVLTFEVKKNIFPTSIVNKPDYFRKDLVKFNTYENLNPFNHGLYGSSVWPKTSQAIIDGLADISMYDDYKAPTFSKVMSACHDLVNKDLDENGKHIYKLIPSTIKFMNDLFVDININRILATPTFDQKNKECLMSVDWIDYFSNKHTEISRATDKTNFGAHLVMETDTTGLTSNEHGREYTDPSIKLKFITLNWDNMNMWPEVKGKQKEWTVPAYAQIGTAGDGYRKLFRSVDEITHPNVWGATNWDDVMPSSEQSKLQLAGGVLRKRGTWGPDRNYVAPSEKDKKYYYSVENPVFEIPLGEYDTQIDFKYNVQDVMHALTKVQASFYKERFDTIMKYIPQESDGEKNEVALNPTESLKHNFVESSISELQYSNLLKETNMEAEADKLKIYTWVWGGDWEPARIEKNGIYKVDYPQVEDVEGQIQYFTIWKGGQLNNINKSESIVFEDHTIIFKKPGCDWEYRNFISGGIYGNGLLTFNEEDDPAYIEECKEAYKAWEPNPHMRFNNELLVSLTRWLLAVSDMGGYLNLNAVDKLTFIDNKDIMNEYRNLDDLVWTSDDVDHAMDTTCYWFMFTGDDGNGEFAPIEKCLGWEKGSMFGIIRDSDGYYHILNFKRSNQFSITMPLKRTQGQSWNEFDFIANDSQFGLISSSDNMNSVFKLPRKFITPGSYKFDFTLDQRFTGEGYLYNRNEDTGEWLDTVSENEVHFNISRSNIYYDKDAKKFYTFAEEWDEETETYKDELSKIALKFNENKFFKNVLTAVVAYSDKKSLGESDTSVEVTPTLENISSIPFAIDKLSANDRVLEIREVLLRSIWNKTLEPTFFSNYAEIDGKIIGFTANNEIILGSSSTDNAVNFEVALKNLGKCTYVYDQKKNKYKAVAEPIPEEGLKFSASDALLLSDTSVTFSEISREGDEAEVAEKANFKYFKNNLILKGTIDLQNPAVVYSTNPKFATALPYIQAGDALVDGKALSAASDRTKTTFSILDAYGNKSVSSFRCVDLKFVGNEFVAISDNGYIYYSLNAKYDSDSSIRCNLFQITEQMTLKSVFYDNGWVVQSDTGLYKLDLVGTPSYTQLWAEEVEGQPLAIGNVIFKEDFGVKVLVSETDISINSNNNWRTYKLSQVFTVLGHEEEEILDVVITSQSTVLLTEHYIFVFDNYNDYYTESKMTEIEGVSATYQKIKVANGIPFIIGNLTGDVENVPNEDETTSTVHIDEPLVLYSDTFGYNFTPITLDASIKDFELDCVVNTGTRYLMSFISETQTEVFESLIETGLSTFNLTTSYSFDDIHPVKQVIYGADIFEIANGRITLCSYKNLGVTKGFFVTGVSENSISFSSGLTTGYGTGTIEVLIAIRTAADILDQFAFINASDNIFNPNGNFAVKEVSEADDKSVANRVYSMNEIEETGKGYSSVAADTEHKYYEYDVLEDEYIPVTLTNDNGNALKLCNEDGTELLNKTLFKAKDRSGIVYSAFANASTPKYLTLEDLNKEASIRQEFTGFLNIISDKNKFISHIDPAHQKLTLIVDDLNRNLVKVVDENNVNQLLWTDLSEFLAQTRADPSKYEIRSVFTPDSNLEENIEAVILEASGQEDDYESTEDNSDILNAVWDKEGQFFVPKKNVYLSTSLSVPYTFVGGNLAFSTGDFSWVGAEGRFETPVTGVYLPEKGYGGHRENSDGWKKHKPWDFDPLAFAGNDVNVKDRYLKNEKGEFVFIVDKLGNAIESENCESPIYSNGEDLTIDKDFFGGSSTKTIELENSVEKNSGITFKYLPPSSPEVYTSSTNLVLGNTPFSMSMFFFRNGEEIEVSNISFVEIDKSGDENNISFVYEKGTHTLSYNPVGSSANPQYLKVSFTFGEKEYVHLIPVQVWSTEIPSQASILIDNPVIFFKDLAGKYSYFGEGRASMNISQDVAVLSSWTDVKRPLSVANQTGNVIELHANNNSEFGDTDLAIPCKDSSYIMYAVLPYIYFGNINAYYSSVKNDSQKLSNITSITRLVLLNFVSRVNGLYSTTEENKKIQVEDWRNRLIGTSNDEYKVSIFENEYSTKTNIIRLNDFKNKVAGLSGEAVLTQRIENIISLMNSDIEVETGILNENIFGNNGKLYNEIMNFYDGVTGVVNFIENARDIQACYVNDRKLSVVFNKNDEGTIDVIYQNKIISRVQASSLETTVTCGYYFADKDNIDVFVTDNSPIKIHIFNSLNEPLIIKGIKGKIICRLPKYNTFSDLVNEMEGLGYVIDKDIIEVSEKNNEAVNTFDTLNTEKSSATLSKVIDTDSHFIKIKVLTQKTIATTELMFDKDESFVQISEDDIIDFPPDRVWFHRDEAGHGDGFPLPPVLFYDNKQNVTSILREENNYAYYNKDYENGNSYPIYECDETGHFVVYQDNTGVTRRANKADFNDNVYDLHQPRRPLYQTCKDWFRNDFYLEGSESNPFWQIVEISSFFNTVSKNWEQTGKTFEYIKSAKGMKLAKVKDEDRYVELGRASLYKATTSGIEVETNADFVDLQNGEIRFTVALNENWAGSSDDKIRLVKYGINAYNSFNTFHQFNKENAKVLTLNETATLHSYLTSQYTVNSKENLVSTNDKDSAIVPITEIGLFNKQHQMIAYAHFPAIEYRSDTQHLDFTMFIHNGVMKS